MIRKSTLADELGCQYPQFRLELRAIERDNSDFFTGRRQYLTPAEEKTVREHFAHMKALSVKSVEKK